MDKLRNVLVAAVVMIFVSQSLYAQMNTWNGDPREEDATNAHSIYRQAIKAEDWGIAFDNWKIAYELAPLADGKRDYHFIDGAKIYVHKYKSATEEEKAQYKEIINRLYDEAVEAYEKKLITPSTCASDPDCHNKRIGYVLGRKGFDMFYTLNSPYKTNLEVFKKAMDYGSTDTEYIVFDPVFSMLVYQFQKGKIDKEEVLEYYNTMEYIVEYNVEHNERLGQYYDQAWKAAKAKLNPIEADIFDCDYFLPKYKELYDANPDDYDNVRTVLGLLKKRGCPEDNPFVAKVDEKWRVYAEKENARLQAEFEANNPSVKAKKLYDEGDYKGAIAKYDEALSQETDPVKQAGYLFSKASIQFRKLKQYSTARNTAYKAAKLRPGWGRPYMLIGDMYASSARNCGDSWNQRLAIIAAIDKYNYAKSIDGEVADEARDRVRKYNSSLPDKADGHMRGANTGDSVKVGCWIGETVKVRFKS